MGFVVDAANGALGLTLDRIRREEDHGQFNVRPQIDFKQQADLRAMQADGRKEEIFRQCLEHYRFRWFEIPELPMLEGGVARVEGEWRNIKLGLAFTPQDLVSSFPMGPESLDTYLKERITELKIQAGKLPRAARAKARR